MMTIRFTGLAFAMLTLAGSLAAPAAAGEKRFHFQLDRAPLPDVLRAMARAYGLNYILPSALRGRTITMSSDRPMRADEARNALSMALEGAGLGTEQRGGFLLVVERVRSLRLLPRIEQQANALGLDVSELSSQPVRAQRPVVERVEVKLRVSDLASLQRLLGSIAGGRPDLVVERVMTSSSFRDPGQIKARFRLGRLRESRSTPQRNDALNRLRAVRACLPKVAGLRIERLDFGPDRLRLRGRASSSVVVATFFALLNTRPGFRMISPGQVELTPGDTTVGFRLDVRLD